MIEYLNTEIAWWHWMAFGLLLALGEMLLPSFFLLLLGVSAMVVGVLLALIPLTFTTQLLIWAGLSVLDVVAWFVVIQPRIPDRTKSGMAMEALIGQTGTLVDANQTTNRGRVRFPAPIVGSDEWDCILQGAVSAGDRVTVLQISGNNLVVGLQ